MIMITQNERHETARQLTAKGTPSLRENCVCIVTEDWIDDFINLYDSTDECVNRDDAITKKLGEVCDSKTALALKFLLDHVDGIVRKEFVYTFLVSNVCAGQSSMTMEVKWIGHTDKKRKTNGRARLYLNKNGMNEQVHFKRKSSFILYLIYLLDVYQSEKNTALDITKHDEQFCTLFKNVYAYDGGMEQFKTLLGKGNSEQELLRHCLSDIRHAIGNSCRKLDEDASPYVLANKQSYLGIPKKNVVIDEQFLQKIQRKT